MLLAACGPACGPVEPVVVDPAELAAFANAFFANELEVLHIPGLVSVFVQGGEVVWAGVRISCFSTPRDRAREPYRTIYLEAA